MTEKILSMPDGFRLFTRIHRSASNQSVKRSGDGRFHAIFLFLFLPVCLIVDQAATIDAKENERNERERERERTLLILGK